jgi:L-gulonolactone oxidase
MKVSSEKQHLLNAFRLSYGALGVIAEATLRVRPQMTFTANHRGLSIGTFADVTDRLAERDVGFKFYLLPHKDRVYLDLRRYEPSPGSPYNAPWKIKDWGESTVLPQVFKSLGRVLPIPSMRYRLIDSISTATYDLVNTRLVRNGNNVTATGRHRRRKPRGLQYSSWCFPATDFSVVIKAYTEFCRETYARTGFRCDLPAVGFRVSRDNSALLSPSFDEPAIVLQATTTQSAGWEDFVIDFSQFAENWGGTPIFSQSRALRADFARQMYSQRLEFFRKVRRQLDPRNRLLNPFLAQYFA